MDLLQNAEKKGVKIMQIRLNFVKITCILSTKIMWITLRSRLISVDN